MTSNNLDELIGMLAADARPVEPLRAPGWRALATLAVITLVGGLAIVLLSGTDPFTVRAASEQRLAAFGMLAMAATGVLGIIAAFHLSVPGRSRRWVAAPLPPFAAWLLLSGVGCYRDLVRNGPDGLGIGHTADCLFFILAASLLVGLPLFWRLSRARPIDPLPVAVAAALGSAALSALLLQFFHPFAITFIDLAVHMSAVLIVIGLASLFSRKTLRPA